MGIAIDHLLPRNSLKTLCQVTSKPNIDFSGL